VDIERLIPRTGEYIWTSVTEWWDWTVVNPERVLLQGVIFSLLAVTFWLMLTVWDEKRRQLLRGSKMPRKARHKWVRRHMLERWISATETDIVRGVLTESEGTAMIRWLKRATSPEDFAAVKIAQKAGDKKSLSLRECISIRMSHLGKRYLYTPVKIPGPPVPAAQAKALEKPTRKKGEMFARKTKTA
jgi:hypothetical protein